jgi:hypothetical protein
MITEVVEMPDFIRRAKALMSDAERMELIDGLARDPQAGASLGQGLYKARVGRTGEGKSGGFRTVHFFRQDTGPVILLTIFAKNAKSNLSDTELTLLGRIGEAVAKELGGRT